MEEWILQFTVDLSLPIRVTSVKNFSYKFLLYYIERRIPPPS